MSQPIGTIIEPPKSDTGGIPTIKLDTGKTDGNTNPVTDTRNEPEIIAGFESADPDTVRIDTVISGRRKRGRPAGSSRGGTAGIGTATQTPHSLVDLTTLLLSIHQMGASILDIEELELDKSEAVAMSDAIKEVAKHYPTSIDPKKLAILNLTAVMGGIYGSRIMAYRKRVAKDPTKKVVSIEQPRPKAQPQTQTTQQQNSALFPSQIWDGPPVDSAGGF